jgi:hypothetical protein
MEKQFEWIHSDKYPAAIEVAKRFVGKSLNRMVLTLIQHKEDGSIAVTDSHRALFVKNIHGFKEEYLINPLSLEFAKGQYPDTSKLVPEDATTVIRLNEEQLKIWLQMYKSMNQLTKMKNMNPVIYLKMNEEGFSFLVKGTDITFTLPAEEYEFSEDVKQIAYNPLYLRDSLEAHVKLGSKSVDIKIKGQLRPFVLDNNNDVQALILPVRTYDGE